MRWGIAAVAAVAAVTVLALAGCSNLGYYLQSAEGHMKILSAARPVPEWLSDPATPERIRKRLILTQRIRAYAVSELKLPDNASYHRYADLHRNAAIWNVVAAPAFSLTLKTWCFPVTGCVGYHGFYDENRANHDAQELRAQGYEVSVYPVPAYSTLGWSNWIGGDPLLNTFINYPEGELARLIFHELAHQVLYVRDDTTFNESFAVSVERIGGRMWLNTQASEQARKEYADYDGRRRQFKALQLATREKLKAIYDQTALSPAELASRKKAAMQEFREAYVKLRDSWGGDPARWRGYDRWVEQANNAAFGAQAAYDELVPGFEALFRREGGDWKRFYDAVKALAALPRAERRRRLEEMT
ncbi:MAG TPA: aminopeptidase [Ramlibacter sp.]|uniref:aminopeptidase n=1 Tax=Ramlibacter sp. TaxID=1917967 RepID=UPI002B8875B0|nr:aminopeptidase [Ramlibacter sp.]HVZ42298.1 aminopeptidase [Ramlibacter sp.]